MIAIPSESKPQRLHPIPEVKILSQQKIADIHSSYPASGRNHRHAKRKDGSSAVKLRRFWLSGNRRADGAPRPPRPEPMRASVRARPAGGHRGAHRGPGQSSAAATGGPIRGGPRRPAAALDGAAAPVVPPGRRPGCLRSAAGQCGPVRRSRSLLLTVLHPPAGPHAVGRDGLGRFDRARRCPPCSASFGAPAAAATERFGGKTGCCCCCGCGGVRVAHLEDPRLPRPASPWWSVCPPQPPHPSNFPSLV